MKRRVIAISLGVAAAWPVMFVADSVATGAIAPPAKDPMTATIERKTCLAPDGVTIMYSAAGVGETALVFVHGGLADRSFFEGQLKPIPHPKSRGWNCPGKN